ncbi:MAG: TrkH family potassium uptake protein [Candidatus Omnitrophica bacterium]|nr:TrkH family potassium uptake protein [Candidatus Omnitrophota bacterium]
MSKSFIIFSVGKLLEILALVLIIPAAIAFFEIPTKVFPAILLDYRLLGFLIAIVSSFICGNILKLIGSDELTGTGIREGFAIVTFGWIILTVFGSVPLFLYFISQTEAVTTSVVIRAFTDSYFEIMSGFTTTGASIMTNIEALPRGILFWRSMTHWLGGMGIITLALAILPAFGIASYQMFRGEVPGPTSERLQPRIGQTAKILWGVYALLTLVEVILLNFGGMSIFDALCHAFGTMATGGFSTKSASIGAYKSAYIDWVVIVFMFFAGMNFLIHYQVLFARKWNLVKNNREFRFYSAVLIIAIILSAFVLQTRGLAPKEQIARSFRSEPIAGSMLAEKIADQEKKISSFHDKVRNATFQVVSITTTTGYSTADSDMWPNFIRFMLVVLMFFGGCAGSTGGGIKMTRIMIGIKTAWREVKTLIQPRLISPIKIAGKELKEKQVANIVGFIALFLGCFVILSAVMSFLISDFTTAVTSVVATMCNIGPGLSGIGAAENYAWIPIPGKWVLCLSMLLGRLEIYTVLIALSPISWRK